MSAKTSAIPTTLAEIHNWQVFGYQILELDVRVAFAPAEPVTFKAVSY